jgi:hypothetical protein
MLTSPSRANTEDRKLSGGYTSNSTWRERQSLPAPASPARPPTPRPCQNPTSSVTHPNLEIMDERVFLPRWLFSIYMQMQRHGMEGYPTYCRKSEYITCRNSACRNSACRNSGPRNRSSRSISGQIESIVGSLKSRSSRVDRRERSTRSIWRFNLSLSIKITT